MTAMNNLRQASFLEESHTQRKHTRVHTQHNIQRKEINRLLNIMRLLSQCRHFKGKISSDILGSNWSNHAQCPLNGQTVHPNLQNQKSGFKSFTPDL